MLWIWWIAGFRSVGFGFMSPGAVDANGGGQSPGSSNSDDAGEMEARFADLCKVFLVFLSQFV